MRTIALTGLHAALATPFDETGAVDLGRLGAHAQALVSRGLDGVAPFGTTGEGASIGAAERIAGLDAVLRAGVPADRVTLGLSSCAVPDTVALLHQAADRGVARALLPPPFYFREAAGQGLRDWFSQVVSQAPDGCGVVLYHIPQVTGVPLDPALVGALDAAFPGRIAGVKDSSGDRASAQGFLALGDMPVLVGDERQLAGAVREGAAGAISGMANVLPERMARGVAAGHDDPGLGALVDAVVAGPVIAGVKALLAHVSGEPGWARTRAPLAPLGAEAAVRLAGHLPEDAR
ncbi:MAG: dihydrodipicolinate synthase family protein [Paracoccaceae bacterium]